MKKLVFNALASMIVIPSLAHALTYQVLGDNGKVIASGERQITAPETVGNFTVGMLGTLRAGEHMAWSGDSNSITSIDNLNQKTDTSSSSDTKAFGWCFKVNGVLPDKGAAQTSIGDADTLTWYYGYALEINGIWQPECVPANQ